MTDRPERDPGLAESLRRAEALLQERGRAREAYRLLIRHFFSPELAGFPQLRTRLVELLHSSALEADPELAYLMEHDVHARFDRSAGGTSGAVLKAFYFGGACHGETRGERVSMALRELEHRMRRDKTIVPQSYTIEFAKTFSSSSPLMDLSPDRAAGGGYFLNLGGFGCVVDPGHNFLQNFYELKHTLYDIDCIIVTHFHDDHYADLPALMSLLYQRWRQDPGRPVRVLLDQTTFKMFQPIIDFSAGKGSGYLRDPVVLRPNSRRPIALAPGVVLESLPTRHDIFGRNTGVGLAFTMKAIKRHLLITGDTAWFPALNRALRRRRKYDVVLVAHLSSAWPEEAVGTLTRGRESFYRKHLCIHGLCKAVEAAAPKHLILSEIGEELEGVIPDLTQMLRAAYGIEVSCGNRAAGAFHL